MKRSVSMIAMLVIAAFTAVTVPALAADQAKPVSVSVNTQTYISDATRRVCSGERGKMYWTASEQIRKNREKLNQDSCREVGLPYIAPRRTA